MCVLRTLVSHLEVTGRIDFCSADEQLPLSVSFSGLGCLEMTYRSNHNSIACPCLYSNNSTLTEISVNIRK